MIESKSKLCALLIRISKLLSRENVQQLVFMTMELIGSRQLSEKCEESGNALLFFQAMRDRDLYTHTDPSLLLEHLKIIDRQDAVMMLEKEMGVPSQKDHSTDQQMRSPMNQVPGARCSFNETASVPNRLNSSSSVDLGQQTMPLPMDRPPAPEVCRTQLNGDFKDGASKLADTNMALFNQGCTAGNKEPEASLRGDKTSAMNFPDIPDRHPAGNYPAVPERPPRAGNKGRIGSSASGSSSPGSVTTQIAALASTRNHPVMPERFSREGNRDTKGSLANGLSSPGPDRSPATVTSSMLLNSDIPARPPRGSKGNTSSPLKTVFHLPIQESREIFTAAVPTQTVNAARPDATHTIHVQQQYPVVLHRPLGQGIDGPRIEVEQLQGRPPPVPERPPRRPEIPVADCGVEELELCHLSRHFDAGVINLFGHELGYSSERISQLMHDSPRDVSRVFYRLMVEWRSAQHGDSNMRENLANHLRNIHCTVLADDLEVGRFRR